MVPQSSHTQPTLINISVYNVQQTIIPFFSEVPTLHLPPTKKKKAWKHPLNIFEPLQKQKWETPFLRRLPLDEATPMMSSSPSPSPSMTFGRLEGLVTAAPLRSTSSLSRSSLISAMDTERFFCCSRVWRRISRRSWEFGETLNKGEGMVNQMGT